MNQKVKNSGYSQKKYIQIIAVLTVVSLVLIYFLWIKSSKDQASTAMSTELPPVEVVVMEVKKQDVQLFLELPGRVEAFKIAQVRPQIEISGRFNQQCFVS